MADRIIAGIDEVGWGALAGPIISVAAVYRDSDKNKMPYGLGDSKTVSESRREGMYAALHSASVDIGIGWAFPEEVDNGPFEALQLSYTRALNEVAKSGVSHVIIDGSTTVSSWRGSIEVIPKADRDIWQVSAASIIAKVFRDRLMTQEGLKFPQYGWANNKGYGTRDHIQAIEQYGLLVKPGAYFHRKSYCRKFV